MTGRAAALSDTSRYSFLLYNLVNLIEECPNAEGEITEDGPISVKHLINLTEQETQEIFSPDDYGLESQLTKAAYDASKVTVPTSLPYYPSGEFFTHVRRLLEATPMIPTSPSYKKTVKALFDMDDDGTINRKLTKLLGIMDGSKTMDETNIFKCMAHLLQELTPAVIKLQEKVDAATAFWKQLQEWEQNISSGKNLESELQIETAAWESPPSEDNKGSLEPIKKRFVDLMKNMKSNGDRLRDSFNKWISTGPPTPVLNLTVNDSEIFLGYTVTKLDVETGVCEDIWTFVEQSGLKRAALFLTSLLNDPYPRIKIPHEINDYIQHLANTIKEAAARANPTISHPVVDSPEQVSQDADNEDGTPPPAPGNRVSNDIRTQQEMFPPRFQPTGRSRFGYGNNLGGNSRDTYLERTRSRDYIQKKVSDLGEIIGDLEKRVKKEEAIDVAELDFISKKVSGCATDCAQFLQKNGSDAEPVVIIDGDRKTCGAWLDKWEYYIMRLKSKEVAKKKEDELEAKTRMSRLSAAEIMKPTRDNIVEFYQQIASLQEGLKREEEKLYLVERIKKVLPEDKKSECRQVRKMEELEEYIARWYIDGRLLDKTLLSKMYAIKSPRNQVEEADNISSFYTLFYQLKSIHKEDCINETILADLSPKILSNRWHSIYTSAFKKFGKFSKKKQRRIINEGDLEACKKASREKATLISFSDDEEDEEAETDTAAKKREGGFLGRMNYMSSDDTSCTPRMARNFFLLVLAEAMAVAQSSIDRYNHHEDGGEKKKGNGRGYFQFKKKNNAENNAYVSEENSAFSQEQWQKTVDEQLKTLRPQSAGNDEKTAAADENAAAVAANQPIKRGSWDKKEDQICPLDCYFGTHRYGSLANCPVLLGKLPIERIDLLRHLHYFNRCCLRSHAHKRDVTCKTNPNGCSYCGKKDHHRLLCTTEEAIIGNTAGYLRQQDKNDKFANGNRNEKVALASEIGGEDKLSRGDYGPDERSPVDPDDLCEISYAPNYHDESCGMAHEIGAGDQNNMESFLGLGPEKKGPDISQRKKKGKRRSPKDDWNSYDQHQLKTSICTTLGVAACYDFYNLMNKITIRGYNVVVDIRGVIEELLKKNEEYKIKSGPTISDRENGDQLLQNAYFCLHKLEAKNKGNRLNKKLQALTKDWSFPEKQMSFSFRMMLSIAEDTIRSHDRESNMEIDDFVPPDCRYQQYTEKVEHENACMAQETRLFHHTENEMALSVQEVARHRGHDPQEMLKKTLYHPDQSNPAFVDLSDGPTLAMQEKIVKISTGEDCGMEKEYADCQRRIEEKTGRQENALATCEIGGRFGSEAGDLFEPGMITLSRDWPHPDLYEEILESGKNLRRIKPLNGGFGGTYSACFPVLIKPLDHISDEELEDLGLYNIVRQFGERWIKVIACSDSGADNLCLSPRLAGVLEDSIYDSNMMWGVNGEGAESKKKIAVMSNSKGEKFTQIGSSLVRLNMKCKKYSTVDPEYMSRILHIGQENRNKFYFNDEDLPIDLLLGMSSPSTGGRMLARHEMSIVGAQFNPCNPDMRIWYCPISAEGQFKIVGSWGIATENEELPLLVDKSRDIEIINSTTNRKTGDILLKKEKIVRWETLPPSTGGEEDEWKMSRDRLQLLKASFDQEIRPMLNESEAETAAFAAEIECGVDAGNSDLVFAQMVEAQRKAEENFHAGVLVCRAHKSVIRECQDCAKIAGRASADEIELDELMRDSIKFIPDGTFNKHGVPNGRVEADLVLYPSIARKTTIEEIFKNNNLKQATMAAETMFKKLERKPKCMEQFRKTLQSDIDQGFLVEMTEDEVKNCPYSCYFIITNIVENEHSTTTPLRKVKPPFILLLIMLLALCCQVFDTARPIPGAGLTHSMCFRSGHDSVGDAMRTEMAGTLHQMQALSDTSKCYQRLQMGERSQYLCCSLFFDINDDGSRGKLRYFRTTGFLFGVAQSPGYVRLADKVFLAERARTSEAAKVFRDQKFADDSKYSHEEKQVVLDAVDDLVETSATCGFTQKPALGPASLFPEILKEADPKKCRTDSFGYRLDYVAHTKHVSTVIHLGAAHRGAKAENDTLRAIDPWAEDFDMTRRRGLRVSGGLHDMMGTILSMIQLNWKIIMSEMTKLIPKKDGMAYDSSVKEYAEKVFKKMQAFLHNMKDYDIKIKPFSLFQIPYGYRATTISTAVDGSTSAFATVAYIVSKKIKEEVNGPDQFSYVIYAKNHLSEKTTYVNESLGLVLGMKATAEIARNLKHHFPDGMDMAVGNDNRALSYTFGEETILSQISVKNAIVTVKTGLRTMHEVHDATRVILYWHPGESFTSEGNVADFNSKEQPDPIMLTNSLKWRHGIPLYRDWNKMSETKFAEVDRNGSFTYHSLDENLLTPKDKYTADLLKNNAFDSKKNVDKINQKLESFECSAPPANTGQNPTESWVTRLVEESNKPVEQAAAVREKSYGAAQDAAVRKLQCAWRNTLQPISAPYMEQALAAHSELEEGDLINTVDEYVNIVKVTVQNETDAIRDVRKGKLLKMKGLVEDSEVQWVYVKKDRDGDYDSTPETIPDRPDDLDEPACPQTSSPEMSDHNSSVINSEPETERNDDEIDLDTSSTGDPYSYDPSPFQNHVTTMMGGTQKPVLGTSFKPLLRPGNLEEVYKKIGKRFSSFRKQLATWMAILFLPMQRRYKLSGEEILKSRMSDLAMEAFMVMLREDQRIDPVKRRKNDSIVKVPELGILVKHMNINEEDAEFLFGSNTLPVLSYSSKLLDAIYREYHSLPNEIGGVRQIHLSQSLTISKMLTSTFAAFTPGIIRFVRTHQSACALCLRSQEKKYALRLGNHYAGLRSSSNLFEESFIDPICPLKMTLYEGSTRPRTIQTLIVVCKNTLVTAILPMDRKRRQDVVNALSRLEARTGAKIRRVYGDAAQIFNVEDGYLTDGIEMVQLRKYGQSGNLAERKMAEIRLIIDRALSKSPSESIRKSFTWIQLLCFLSLLENLVNQMPYSKNMGAHGLTPDHFFRVHKYIKHDTTKFADNGNFFPLSCEWENVNFYIEECRKFRDEILLQKARQYGQVARGTDIEPTVGDVAFLNATEYLPARMCTVIGVHPRYLTCRMADNGKIENYPRSAICIMIADKLNNNKEEDQDGFEEIEDSGNTSEDEFHSVGSKAPTIGSVPDNE